MAMASNAVGARAAGSSDNGHCDPEANSAARGVAAR
jgi:hypothetical protein